MKLNKLTLGLAIMAVLFLCTQTLIADESQSTEDTQIMHTIETTLANVVSFDNGGGTGTGFYINPTTVLTNYHVVDSMMWEGKVWFTTYQGAIVEATITKYDKAQDFAILNVPPNDNVRVLQTGKVKVGQTILILGNPKGIKFSASKGMVSFIDRPNSVYPNKKTIQIDANVAGGHSGSMVITTDGFLAGVVVERLIANFDVGFAIPIEQIKE